MSVASCDCNAVHRPGQDAATSAWNSSRQDTTAYRGTSNTNSYTDSYTRKTTETPHYIYLDIDGSRESFTVPVTKADTVSATDGRVRHALRDAVARFTPKIDVRPLDRYHKTFE